MICKMKDKYTNLSLQKKAVLWFTFATILQNGILFLVTPIYTRILTDNEYGVFSIYQSWQQIISILSIMALDRCITVGFMKYEKNRESFLSSIQLLMTVMVIISILFCIVFKKTMLTIINLPFYIIVLMCIVSLANNTVANWSWLQRYNYKYIKLAVITVSSTLIVQLIGIISVITIDCNNKGNLMVLTISLAKIIIYSAIYISVFMKGKEGYNRQYWKFSFTYSVAIIPHALSQIILNSSDRIMIDKICGKAKAAYYGVTYSCSMVVSIVLQSISSAVQPWFYEQIKNGNYKAIREKSNIILLCSAIFLIFICLVAPEIISIMAPASYEEAIVVFPTVVGGMFFNSMYLYFANFESYFERPKYFSIATTIGAVFNIILNLIFIPIIGFVAAGYSTLICYILFALMHYYFMRKTCKDESINEDVFDKKFLLFLSLFVLLALFSMIVLYNFLIIRYLLVFIFIAIFSLNYKKVIALFKARR